MALFEKGRAKTGGRLSGTRNKISGAFLEALADHFNEVDERTGKIKGRIAIELVWSEKPAEYLRAIAAILPKEFELNDNRLAQLSDGELDAVIEYVRHELANAASPTDTGSGEKPSLN